MRSTTTPRRHRLSGRHPILRVLAVWLATASVIAVLPVLLSGLTVTGAGPALAAAALLGLLNAFVWPVLAYLALPVTVLTLGGAAVVLNGATVALVAYLLPGIQVDDLGTGVGVALALTVTNAGISALLSLDDEGVYYRRVIRRAARRAGARSPSRIPGVLFIQIDGLGIAVLRRALRDGNAPTLARWLSSGSHRLLGWETGWSSQTGASQCGILHGSTFDLPAFRWLEKETGTVLVSNHPRSAAEIERRHSDGRGLLHADGVGRGNLYTGDAGQSILTMSVAGKVRGRVGRGYYAYFAVPYNALRTLLGFGAEVLREFHQAGRQCRDDVRPRVRRGGAYPFLRAFTTVISRDVTTQTLIGDLYTGRSVIYADFVGYDEVAHHSGPERYDALDTLRRLDRDIGRLEQAAANAPRPYRFVVLSDHGQSQGATFEDRYGYSLGDLVRAAMDTDAVREVGAARVAGDESWGYAQAALSDVVSPDHAVGRTLGRTLRDRRSGPEGGGGDAVVLASGNLGLIYLTGEPGRVTMEMIEKRYPKLVPTLLNHAGVGFVLVRSERLGATVLSRDGMLALDTLTVSGVDPLAAFGQSARWQVTRADSYPHCADLMVNSRWDAQTEEVAAFEHLVGSHGGLGGEQTRPFVLYPADLAPPCDPIHGAEELHRVLRSWLADLGHEAFAERWPGGD
jgi:uncharacterized membrane protein YvlD (DUF360 family)